MNGKITVIGLAMLMISFVACNGQQESTTSNEVATAGLKVTDIGKSLNFSNNSNILPFNGELSFSYEVRGKYRKAITKEKLTKAKKISDIIPHYPSNWIAGYNAVEITTNHNGKEIKAVGNDENLTSEQIKLFNAVDISTDITIDVFYKTKNSVTNLLDEKQMNVSMTVTPKTEATYADGQESLIQMLQEKSLKTIESKEFEEFPFTVIEFTINEKGGVENVKVTKSSGDKEIDELLLQSLQTMSKWIPAKDAKGKAVSQHFEFSVGYGC